MCSFPVPSLRTTSTSLTRFQLKLTSRRRSPSDDLISVRTPTTPYSPPDLSHLQELYRLLKERTTLESPENYTLHFRRTNVVEFKWAKKEAYKEYVRRSFDKVVELVKTAFEKNYKTLEVEVKTPVVIEGEEKFEVSKIKIHVVADILSPLVTHCFQEVLKHKKPKRQIAELCVKTALADVYKEIASIIRFLTDQKASLDNILTRVSIRQQQICVELTGLKTSVLDSLSMLGLKKPLSHFDETNLQEALEMVKERPADVFVYDERVLLPIQELFDSCLEQGQNFKDFYKRIKGEGLKATIQLTSDAALKKPAYAAYKNRDFSSAVNHLSAPYLLKATLTKKRLQAGLQSLLPRLEIVLVDDPSDRHGPIRDRIGNIRDLVKDPDLVIKWDEVGRHIEWLAAVSGRKFSI